MSNTDPDTLPSASDQILSIRMPVELTDKAESAARQTGLKKADVIRLAIDRGVDILLAQLSSPALVAPTVEGE